jgi:hypothetical protein
MRHKSGSDLSPVDLQVWTSLHRRQNAMPTRQVLKHHWREILSQQVADTDQSGQKDRPREGSRERSMVSD